MKRFAHVFVAAGWFFLLTQIPPQPKKNEKTGVVTTGVIVTRIDLDTLAACRTAASNDSNMAFNAASGGRWAVIASPCMSSEDGTVDGY